MGITNQNSEGGCNNKHLLGGYDCENWLVYLLVIYIREISEVGKFLASEVVLGDWGGPEIDIFYILAPSMTNDLSRGPLVPEVLHYTWVNITLLRGNDIYLTICWMWAMCVTHRWEFPILHYHKIMVIYPYPFFAVINQLFPG